MSPAPKKMVLGLVVLVAVGFAGSKAMHWYNKGRFIESTDNAYIQADSVPLRAEITGLIKTVAVKENQQVKKGDLLLQIDPTDYIAGVAEAQAQLLVARSALLDIQQQIKLQDKKLDETKASIEASKAELHRAELERDRAQTLAKQSYGSQQLLQNTEADAEVAKAHLEQARASLAAEKQMVAVYEAKRDSAEASITAAQAGLDLARNQLAKTKLIADRDGVIGNLGARQGTAVLPNMTLMYLVPLPEVYVIANFKETQIGHMSIDQRVELSVDALPDTTFTGLVESISPATGSEFSLLPQDNATGNFNKIVQRVPVRIRVTGPAEMLPRLRPGLSVVPSVDTEHFQQQVSYLQLNQTRDPDPSGLSNTDIAGR
ncbi:HlyD family secretion protein [Ketobacter sp. MCCC 1A13808]|uniref:HlyD family secretion protein n=1 Tax=Ketobacter sp. MCCC 1A13808 TaxID=2602738 RepID=UPI0012EC8565|nr:HlyD family secretion protein [Ketobacter sp. MCCC 1A13808]MVF11937.1 HlyD family secretion protein [Ketobacter sp. MCCC 1A13808]